MFPMPVCALCWLPVSCWRFADRPEGRLTHSRGAEKGTLRFMNEAATGKLLEPRADSVLRHIQRFRSVTVAQEYLAIIRAAEPALEFDI